MGGWQVCVARSYPTLFFVRLTPPTSISKRQVFFDSCSAVNIIPEDMSSLLTKCSLNSHEELLAWGDASVVRYCLQDGGTGDDLHYDSWASVSLSRIST